MSAKEKRTRVEFQLPLRRQARQTKAEDVLQAQYAKLQNISCTYAVERWHCFTVYRVNIN
jgi:hypothetical protein